MFVNANLAEAVLWSSIGIGFLIAGVRHARRRRFLWILAAAFVTFGVSDVIESRTGAWWRPWWLLALKGGCLLVFAVALAKYARMKRATKTIPDSDDDGDGTSPRAQRGEARDR